MGYAITVPNVIVEYASDITTTNSVITTVAANIGLSQISIPTDLQGAIYHAYLDLVLPYVKEESGLDNKLDGNQYVKIYLNSDLINQYNAIYFPDDSFMIPASAGIHYGRIYGNIDVASYLNAGDDVHVFWEASKCDGNVIRLYGNQTVLRLVLGV